jgi:hypothetical protein
MAIMAGTNTVTVMTMTMTMTMITTMNPGMIILTHMGMLTS